MSAFFVSESNSYLSRATLAGGYVHSFLWAWHDIGMVETPFYSRALIPSQCTCPLFTFDHRFDQETPAHCVLYSSGLAAAFGIFSHFLPKRVFITGGYHGTHQVLAQLQKISDGARYKKEPLRSPEEQLGWGKTRAPWNP